MFPRVSTQVSPEQILKSPPYVCTPVGNWYVTSFQGQMNKKSVNVTSFNNKNPKCEKPLKH